jgi:ABC-type multidrug transport system fused ATPase/permease subunit
MSQISHCFFFSTFPFPSLLILSLSSSLSISFFSSLPQVSSYKLAPTNLPAWMLVQTFAFVAFNKVITAQYFTWFAFLILLVLPVNTDNSIFRRRKNDGNVSKYDRKMEKSSSEKEKERIHAIEYIEKYTEKRIEKINNNNNNNKCNNNHSKNTVNNVYFNIFLILLLWIFSLSLWLIQAYLLEFLGKNTFLVLWSASVFFHIVNSFIIVLIVLYFKEEKERGNKKGK